MLGKDDFDYLRKIDFNSALYFSAVMNYKTIFNASVVLNCSPPTVSLMLKRFCSYFPVPIFEREGRCLTPTKFAIELNELITSMFHNCNYSIRTNDKNQSIFNTHHRGSESSLRKRDGQHLNK